MITTRDIKVDLSRERRPLSQKTTKEVNVYVKKGTPKPSKIVVTTHNIEEVTARNEKKRRDDIARQIIMTEQKAAEILSATVEQGKEAIEGLVEGLENKKEKDLAKKERNEIEEKTAIYQEINELKARELAIKKQKDKEKMAKARAARGKKK